VRALALCLLLAGCSTTPELTVLVGPRWSEGKQDVAATFMVIQKVGKHAVLGGVHQSEPSRGKPFDSREEETGDMAGVGVRFGGKPRD
jgi:starvation-inducible outer membrane lipoprotein